MVGPSYIPLPFRENGNIGAVVPVSRCSLRSDLLSLFHGSDHPTRPRTRLHPRMSCRQTCVSNIRLDLKNPRTSRTTPTLPHDGRSHFLPIRKSSPQNGNRQAPLASSIYDSSRTSKHDKRFQFCSVSLRTHSTSLYQTEPSDLLSAGMLVGSQVSAKLD